MTSQKTSDSFLNHKSRWYTCPHTNPHHFITIFEVKYGPRQTAVVKGTAALPGAQPGPPHPHLASQPSTQLGGANASLPLAFTCAHVHAHILTHHNIITPSGYMSGKRPFSFLNYPVSTFPEGQQQAPTKVLLRPP